MKTAPALVLGCAVALVATSMMAGCEVDESAPTRPRTQNVLSPDEKAKDNAEKRSLEAPDRNLPTSGSEFPGQSRANPPASSDETPVLTADAGEYRLAPYGSFRTPTSDFNHDFYKGGPLPHLPENPGSAPATGSSPVPNTPWSVDNSWGEVLPMQDYPHRAWPDEQTTYRDAVVKHNPTYYFNIQDKLPVTPVSATPVGGWVSNAFEIPWFYLNTAALPVLMVLEPPLMQRTTDRTGADPIYHGYLPSTGQIIPSPTPGQIKWEYPFLKSSNHNANGTPTTMPATTQMQELPPVAPTLETPATTAPR